jgi:hypothetical protein
MQKCQLASEVIFNIAYVGNEGHFEPTDGRNPPGY